MSSAQRVDGLMARVAVCRTARMTMVHNRAGGCCPAAATSGGTTTQRRAASSRSSSRVPVNARPERQHLVEQGADPEDIGALVDLVVATPGLLGRHVGWRTAAERQPAGRCRPWAGGIPPNREALVR